MYADQFISHAGGPAVTNGIQIGQGQALYLGQDAKNVPAVKQFTTYVKKVNPSVGARPLHALRVGVGQPVRAGVEGGGPHPTRGA